jgi:hypothetical protein
MSENPMIDPSSIESPRKKGGQPGNHNAIKHGLYIRQGYLSNLSPVDRAQLCDCKDIITHFKEYMEHLFTIGLQSKDLTEVNETLRSKSIASMALTRLIHTQEDNYKFDVPGVKRKGYQSPSISATHRGLIKYLSASTDSPALAIPTYFQAVADSDEDTQCQILQETIKNIISDALGESLPSQNSDSEEKDE